MSAVWSRAWSWVDEQEHLDLLLMASMVSIVVTAHHDLVFMALTAAIAVIVIRSRSIRHNPFTWLAIGAGSLAWHLPTWFRFDNHVWLTIAWALAVGLCLLTREPDRATKVDGRWLVAIIFGIGALWKLGSGDFRSGSFFHHALLTDDRFATLASWVGGVPAGELGPTNAEVAGLVAAPEVPVGLETTDRLRGMAWVFTVWGALIEVIIAVLWMFPLGSRLLWLRHAALLAFVATTYLVVPVGGFGCLLMVLGLSQVRGEHRMRRVYLGMFLALLIYGPIWRAVLGP